MGFTSLSLPLTPHGFSCCQTGCWAHVSVSLWGSGCLWILQEGLRQGPLLLIQYQVFFSEGNVNVEGGGFGRTSEVLWEKAEREVPHSQGELLRWLDLLGHLFEQQLATVAAIVHVQGQLSCSSLNFELPAPAGSFLSQFPLAKMRL